jgi:hypothetical protein
VRIGRLRCAGNGGECDNLPRSLAVRIELVNRREIMRWRLSSAGLALLAFAASCGADNQPISSSSGAQSSGPTETQAPTDAAATETAPAQANCRWQGYGIGPLGRGQCQTEHLLAHSAEDCDASGGVPSTTRNVIDQCAGGEADEVQALCCFPGVIPAAGDTPVGTLDRLDQRLLGPASRDELVSEAADGCVARGMILEDWSVLYAPDGTTAEALRFGCR